MAAPSADAPPLGYTTTTVTKGGITRNRFQNRPNRQCRSLPRLRNVQESPRRLASNFNDGFALADDSRQPTAPALAALGEESSDDAPSGLFQAASAA
jgi:hypothetical protein